MKIKPLKSGNSKKNNNDLASLKGKLIMMPDGIFLYYFGKPTPVAVKRAVEKTKELCIANGLDFYSPSKDDSLMDSTVDGITDYQNLSSSVNIEWSEIYREYITEEGGFYLSIKRSLVAIILYIF